MGGGGWTKVSKVPEKSSEGPQKFLARYFLHYRNRKKKSELHSGESTGGGACVLGEKKKISHVMNGVEGRLIVLYPGGLGTKKHAT